MREPTLLPVFGRLGVKPPVAVAAMSTRSRSMKNVGASVRKGLSSPRGLFWKPGVVLWTVVALAAVFFIMQA
ncbi:hypothetical protein FJ930_26775 [Mesorhizobium sp. B2-4-15]|nr:hypothetical protein FJ930_26775 [Mesorhizobium sp. B2-4-15]TPM16314.1 hypothetical protein FJ958_29390 [Mesorhizobium sp. B2-3-5]